MFILKNNGLRRQISKGWDASRFFSALSACEYTTWVAGCFL